MLWTLILVNLFAQITVSTTCTNARPLELPVTNVLLSNGQTMRGVWTSVGTPAQNISLFPSVLLNDTWIYNTTSPFCADDVNSTTAECTTLRGGLYSPQNSSTAVEKANVYAAGADASDTADSWIDGWVQDGFHLGNVTLDRYPIGMPGMSMSSQWMTMANLGLNSNSTILTELKSAGTIASRSYSWWWGVATGPNQMDGSIVFGGYDAAKTTGQNFSLPVVPSRIGCPGGMYVTVTDLQLNYKNGSNSSIMNNKPAFSACLEPDRSTVMSIDAEYLETFSNMTQTSQIGREGQPGFTSWGLLYSPDNVYDGGLTITLNNAYSVKIPNDILVISPQYVESNGSIQTNTSVRELLIDPVADVTAFTMPYIGKQFFSQTYLTVDFDIGMFYLSQAIATTEGNLVMIGDTCTPNTTETTTDDQAHSTAKNNALTQGAIVSIVMGSVTGTAIILISGTLIMMAKIRRDPCRLKTITTDTITWPGDDLPP